MREARATMGEGKRSPIGVSPLRSFAPLSPVNGYRIHTSVLACANLLSPEAKPERERSGEGRLG